MKRKLIELGNGCLVVSIPAKYARKQLLKKGDELQMVEEGNDLRIAKGQSVQKNRSYSYDAGRNERIGRRVIAACYRLGLIELKLSYGDQKYLESIQKTLQEQTIGFEIVKLEERACFIKDLSKSSPEEFGIIVQRCWSLLLDMAKDTFEGIKKSDFGLLATMHVKDRSVNKFTNYAMRILLSGSSHTYLQAISYYHYLHLFEELADEYQDMATYVGGQKISVADDHLAALEEINESLRQISHSFNNFDDKRAEETLAGIYSVLSRLLGKKSQEKKRVVIAYHAISICRRARNLMSSIVELRTCERIMA